MFVFKAMNDRFFNNFARHVVGLINPGLNPEATETRIKPFNAQTHTSFQDIPILELRKMIFLGHGSKNRFDDFTAEQFAEKFNREFELTHKTAEDKLRINAIYLLSCNVGLHQEGNPALAQRIADLLYQKGFKNIKIYAVACEQNAFNDKFVINAVGSVPLWLRDKMKPGFIAGQYLPDGNMQAPNPNLQYSSPLAVFNDPRNTFLPFETFTQRKNRIEYCGARYNELCAAMDVIAKRIIHLSKEPYGNSTTIMKLKDLLNNLGYDSISWKAKCIAAINNFKPGITRDIIKKLAAGKIEEAAERVEQTNKSPLNKIISAIERSFSTEQDVAFLPAAPHYDTAIKDTLADSAKLNAFKSRITELNKKLDEEIKVLRSSWLYSFIYSYEIQTKLVKRDCLKEMAKEHSLEGLYRKALAATQNDRIMRSFRTDRTKKILQDIVSVYTKPLAAAPIRQNRF